MAHLRTLVAPCLAVVSLGAYEPVLDLRAIDEAIAIGQARSALVRDRFHERYRLPVSRPPVDYVEVVTPFRRVVLAAEERAQAGDRLFRQRDALDAAAAHRGTLQLFVELTFHPLNTYVGVPAFDVALAAGETMRIAASEVHRIPRSEPRVGGMRWFYPASPGATGGQPLVGGTVLAIFERDRVDSRAAYDVVIEEMSMERARVRVDLASLR